MLGIRHRRSSGRHAPRPLEALAVTAMGLAGLTVPDCAAVGSDQPREDHAEPRDGIVSFPGPDWGYASPQTDLTFRGARVEDLERLSVVGSATGHHGGTVHALRVGTGAVFSPARPFERGERVSVRLCCRVHGASGRSFTFSVAEKGEGPPRAPEPMPTTGTRPPGTTRQPQLRTIPGPQPPAVTMRRLSAEPPGHRLLFVSPRPPSDARRRRPSLMILDGHGRVVWYRPQPTVVHDLHPAVLDGKPVLAYYLRRHDARDVHEVVDQHYRVVLRTHASYGYDDNAHEFQITPQGTAYFAIYDAVWVPEARRRVIDFVVQEVDLQTRDVLFEWHSLDHVPLSASYVPPPTDGKPWDYFHGNSIDPPAGGSGTILVSARKTSSVYAIDRRTGDVRWILGGDQDQFGIVRDHPGWRFCAQHDARRLPDGDVSLFDNGGTALAGGAHCPVHRARVLRFDVDGARKRVRLVRSVSSRSSSDDGRGYFADVVGSARWQPNGDVLVSWGNTGRITQVAPSGRPRFKLHLAHWTYRAVRAAWDGRPLGRPAVAIRRRSAGKVDVYASWNGATDIARWRVLAGPRRALRPVGRPHRWRDLETRMRIGLPPGRFAAVQALDRAGRVLGRSVAVR